MTERSFSMGNPFAITRIKGIFGLSTEPESRAALWSKLNLDPNSESGVNE